MHKFMKAFLMLTVLIILTLYNSSKLNCMHHDTYFRKLMLNISGCAQTTWINEGEGVAQMTTILKCSYIGNKSVYMGGAAGGVLN